MVVVDSGNVGHLGAFWWFGRIDLVDLGRRGEWERMDGGVEWSGFLWGEAADFLRRVMELIWVHIYEGSKWRGSRRAARSGFF